MNKLFENKITIRILLGLLIILAFALRSIYLDKFPSGLNADEAAIGYNAYSIIKTGRDEYGQFLPLSFKSFGDYKPGLYFYFTIPFVFLFGLSEWAVRLPSAILGTAMVLVIFLLSKEIFQDKKVAFFTAFFLAINPWLIHFSRGGWETNAATFFITLGVYLFIKALLKKKYLFWSFLSFLTSMYLYQSPRLIVPVLVLILLTIYKDKLTMVAKNNLRQFSFSIVLLFFLSIPLVFQFISGQGSARFSGLSSFSDPGPANRVNELRGQHSDPDSLGVRAIHNKVSAYLPNFLHQYLNHFSADFLFINGDPLIRNKTPEVGQFYLIQWLFLISGIIFLIKSGSKDRFLIAAWIVSAPLASAMTYQTPHAVRALSLVVPLSLLVGYGFVNLLRLISIRKVKLIAGFLLLIIIGYEFIHYLESYYIHSPKRYPLAWEHGFSEMVEKLNKYESQFDRVVITDTYDQPYILVLFYMKYDPVKYQPQAVLSERDKFNFGTVRGFDKYEFGKVSQEDIKESRGVLFIITPEEAGKEFKEFDTVYFPNGEKAFVFVKS